jgi:hypothetical protein
MSHGNLILNVAPSVQALATNHNLKYFELARGEGLVTDDDYASIGRALKRNSQDAANADCICTQPPER